MEPLFNKKSDYIERVYNDLKDYFGFHDRSMLHTEMIRTINKKYISYLNQYFGFIEAYQEIDDFLKKAMTDYLLLCFEKNKHGFKSGVKGDKEKSFERVYKLLTIANGTASISLYDPYVKAKIVQYAGIPKEEYDEFLNKMFPSDEELQKAAVETYEKVGSLTR